MIKIVFLLFFGASSVLADSTEMTITSSSRMNWAIKYCNKDGAEAWMDLTLEDCEMIAANTDLTMLWTNAHGGALKRKPHKYFYYNFGKGQPVLDANGNKVRRRGNKECLALNVKGCKFVPRTCKGNKLSALCIKADNKANIEPIEWSPWSSWSTLCVHSTVSRTRTCLNRVDDCPEEDSVERKPCKVYDFQNDMTEKLDFKCENNMSISRIESFHDDEFEDRQWKFECVQADYPLVDCELSEYLNAYDKPVDYQCNTRPGTNELWVMTGIYSRFAQFARDRKHKVTCCKLEHNCNNVECSLEAYKNEFNDPIDFITPEDKYLTGVMSFHSNQKEDRSYEFYTCMCK